MNLFQDTTFDFSKISRDEACAKCGLYAGCLNPCIGKYGRGEKGIVVVGEAPGEEEDKQGKPFVGVSGKYLRAVFARLGVDFERDCVVLNACRCRPPNNRTPTHTEIASCRNVLFRDIDGLVKEGNCRVILLFGSVACKAYFGEGDVTLLRGRVIPDLSRKCWVGVTYHPAMVLRARNWDGFIERLFERDIRLALSMKDVEVVDISKALKWEAVTSSDKFGEILSVIKDAGYCVIDIETEKLRPYVPGASVLSIGIGVGDYVWVIDTRSIMKEDIVCFLRQILPNPDIKKIFHEASMEVLWFMMYYGIEVVNYEDTLLMSYVLDEREKSSGLKFLAWVEFGAKGYNNEVERYLNHMSLCPPQLLWKYNAHDVFYTCKLYELYKDEVYAKYRFVYERLLKDSLDVFIRMEMRGCKVDVDYLEKLGEQYRAEKVRLEMELQNIAGSYGMSKVNFRSVRDVRSFLYDCLKLPKLKSTKNGEESTEREVLEELVYLDKTGAVSRLLELRVKEKLLSTYIDGLRELLIDGRVHPHYSLYRTVTGRTSCSDPNIQNIPKRSKEMKEIRNIFVADPGYVLLANDYSQWEVRVVQMYCRDEELGRAIREGIDFHSEYAEVISGLKKDSPGFKEIRQRVKGGFVFASMYGAGVNTITKSLWRGCLDSRFKKFEEAQEFIKELQKQFFERFSGLKEWHDRLRTEYARKGYIETLFGRRRRAPIEYTQLINTPVQSVASDFTLLSMARIWRELGIVPLFMIHDDLTYMVREDEVRDIAKEIARCMCDWDFEFINVPIEVEQKIGYRWGDMQDWRAE